MDENYVSISRNLNQVYLEVIERYNKGLIPNQVFADFCVMILVLILVDHENTMKQMMEKIAAK